VRHTASGLIDPAFPNATRMLATAFPDLDAIGPRLADRLPWGRIIALPDNAKTSAESPQALGLFKVITALCRTIWADGDTSTVHLSFASSGPGRSWRQALAW
jgi:hypothetical protein